MASTEKKLVPYFLGENKTIPVYSLIGLQDHRQPFQPKIFKKGQIDIRKMIAKMLYNTQNTLSFYQNEPMKNRPFLVLHFQCPKKFKIHEVPFWQSWDGCALQVVALKNTSREFK